MFFKSIKRLDHIANECFRRKKKAKAQTST